MDSWASSACYPRRTFYPLSDGPSTRDHRITMTDFRLCLACGPCSQASLCHCTQQPISDRPRVPSTFTGKSISLSMYWRQWGSRYAFRAGRNLPDKEFRYLRTVIVTAAVYRGFDSTPSHPLLTSRPRAGVRPYTSSLDFAESCVFSKQSPPPALCL